MGVYGIIDAPTLACWDAAECDIIAFYEQAAVLWGILHFADKLRSRDVIWFIDNSVALASLCRGGSASAQLDQGSTVAHLLLEACSARAWWGIAQGP